MAISQHEDIWIWSTGCFPADSRERKEGGLFCTDEWLSDFSSLVGVDLRAAKKQHFSVS